MINVNVNDKCETYLIICWSINNDNKQKIKIRSTSYKMCNVSSNIKNTLLNNLNIS